VTRNIQNQTVTVTIMDKAYQVACPPEQQADLIMSANYLDSQMRGIRESGKVVGLERIAVMAALNISHELLLAGRRLEQQEDSGQGQSQAKYQQLNRKLDDALQQLRQTEIP
jgi:cell division protein ZapA